MIKSITVTNYLGDKIKLGLAYPEKSGFIVYKITGLGPVKATINTSEVSTDDGSTFNSSRLSSRNIVISLKYLFGDSIETIRQKSYKYFPIKKEVTLLFETDNRIAEIKGYVESNDPDIFSKESGSDISIICPDPHFYSAGENGKQVTIFYGIDPVFEFPFSNESISSHTLEMGVINPYTESVVTYTGDSEIGVTITIHAVGEASNITVYNTTTQDSMRIDTDKLTLLTGSGIIYGDDIIISTVKRNKYIKLIRNGMEINILNCLERHVNWFQLVKGNNVFTYTAETGTNNLQFKIENQIAYEGV